jgi:hypothetical protein
MSCERFVDAIVDHALGAGIAAEAAAHLDGCGACRARFDEQARAIGGVERELWNALEVTPSPGFTRGVHARIETSRPRQSMMRPIPWGAVAAAAAIAMAVTVYRPTPERGIESAKVTREAPVRPPNSPVADASTAPAAQTPMPGRAPRPSLPAPSVTRRDARSEPEVIVPAQQNARAIARLLALVRSGALDADTMPPDRSASAAQDLVVPPLTVEPISLPEVEIVPTPVRGGRNSQ